MLTALVNVGLGVAVVVLITAFTAYFVAQEFAYTAVNRAGLTARAESGDSASARALAVTRRTSFMLSDAQLGITVTGLLAGWTEYWTSPPARPSTRWSLAPVSTPCRPTN